VIRCSIGGMTRWIPAIVEQMPSWDSMTPLGIPVVPEVNTSWKISSGVGRSHAACFASQSPGNDASGSTATSSTTVLGRCPSPAASGSGASRPVPTRRWRASDRSATRWTAVGDICRSRGT
jgi:hypothetical protein